MDKEVALVSGGARGIGMGISIELLRKNMALAICGTRPEADREKELNRLRKISPDVLYCRCDISCASDREKMLDKIKKRYKRLDLLVNNAGIAPAERKDILEASEESFERLIGVNLKGPYFLTQAVANWMIEQGKENPGFKGKIINITSVSAKFASVDRGDYCISKAALSMTTKLWAARLGEYGICVYEIRPGIIMTDMTSGVKEKYDKLIEEGLLLEKRWGMPEDIGKAVAALAGAAIPYATGTVLNLDGGMTLRRL